MRPFGILLLIAAFIPPTLLFFGLDPKLDQSALFSQWLGSAALIAMGISQLFATRMRGLEFLFGGLDRIYVLHKWLGIIAMVFVLLHDTIDAEMDGLGRETWLVDLAETMGEISLYGLLILVVITIATFIPYHLWKWTHKFMGAFFTASAFHYVFILKPFSNTDPLGLYVLVFCIIGIVAYFYTLMPTVGAKAGKLHVIETIEQTGDSVAVTLKPEGRGLSYTAGQFAFIRFGSAGLTEVHPFTISNAPSDRIRFTIRELGDYTGRLARGLKVGDEARIDGPYGHFRPGRSGKAEIWVAGGIGITPFMAAANDLSDQGSPVHLFYCIRSRNSAAHLSEIEALAAGNPRLHLYLIESGKSGRLTADGIAETLGDISKHQAFFCGPEAMRKSLKKGLTKHGIWGRGFAYEEFEIRTGIGLGYLFKLITGRVFR